MNQHIRVLRTIRGTKTTALVRLVDLFTVRVQELREPMLVAVHEPHLLEENQTGLCLTDYRTGMLLRDPITRMANATAASYTTRTGKAAFKRLLEATGRERAFDVIRNAHATLPALNLPDQPEPAMDEDGEEAYARAQAATVTPGAAHAQA